MFWPGGPGTVDRDGALGIKHPWQRTIRGYLRIEGRRLDGRASRLRAGIPPPSYGYGDFGGTPTHLIYPTPGCWEVSAWVGNRTDLTLTLVIRVVKIAGGPTGYGPTPWLRRLSNVSQHIDRSLRELLQYHHQQAVDLIRCPSRSSCKSIDGVEACGVEDLIQSRVNPCTAVCGRSCVATHIEVCFGRRRRLPIAMCDRVVRGIDRVDPLFIFFIGAAGCDGNHHR